MQKMRRSLPKRRPIHERLLVILKMIKIVRREKIKDCGFVDNPTWVLIHKKCKTIRSISKTDNILWCIKCKDTFPSHDFEKLKLIEL